MRDLVDRRLPPSSTGSPFQLVRPLGERNGVRHAGDVAKQGEQRQCTREQEVVVEALRKVD
jgi:hypothetical protein